MEKRKELLALGFEEMPHFTVGNILNYDLGRNRHLSASCVGTPNEMLFLVENSSENNRLVESIITLKNFDYDGFFKVSEVASLIKILKSDGNIQF